MQGSEGSEFQIPDSGLEGSLELRVPGSAPQETAYQKTIELKAASSLPPDKVIFSRRALYLQAIVFPGTVLLAFSLGYMAGRGRSMPTEGSAQATAQNRVPVEGKVVGDDGAFILVVPTNYDKPARLSGHALLAALGAGPSADCLKSIEQMGGSCARAEPTGKFFLYVPTRGSYRVLIIAHSVDRPGGSPIGDTDRTDIGRYVDDPSAAISSRNYRWMTRELSVEAAKPIEVRFGG